MTKTNNNEGGDDDVKVDLTLLCKAIEARLGDQEKVVLEEMVADNECKVVVFRNDAGNGFFVILTYRDGSGVMVAVSENGVSCTFKQVSVAGSKDDSDSNDDAMGLGLGANRMMREKGAVLQSPQTPEAVLAVLGQIF